MKANALFVRFSHSSLTLALAVLAVAAAMFCAPCAVQAATLTSNNSVATIDPASPLGMYGWSIDGINQLARQSWFFRIGEASGELPLSSLAAPIVTPIGLNALDIRYVGTSVEVTLRYTLIGGSAGSGNSTLAESMRIRNKTAAPMAFHLFEYTDLDLNATPDDDSAALLNVSTIGQWDGATISTETASAGGMTPPPSHWEIGTVPSILLGLTDGAPSLLADAVTPLADSNACFAFQWDMAINAGATQLLSKSKILMRGGAIGDTVWYDTNADGVQDADELGIPGVTMILAADFNDDGIVDYTDTTVTDSSGFYLFPNLPAGAYSVTVDATTLPAGVVQTYDLDGLATPNTASIDLANSEVNLNVDFGYQQLGSIGDRVWNDLNGDGIQDAGEAGINGVTLNLLDTGGNVIATTVTAGDGAYIFGGLSDETYTVSVDVTTLPAGFVATYDLDGGLDSTADAVLAPGENRTDVDFGYRQPASVGDRVWNDLNKNGVQDAGEPGINGVTVSLTDVDGNVLATTVTAGDGGYLFSGLQAGSYAVVVDASTLPAGFEQTYDLDGTLDNSAAVTLAPGENRTDVDFGYWQPASLGDRVWNDLNGNGVQDAGEPGINGVTLTVKDTDGNIVRSTVTAGDGNYFVGNLPAGTYTVSVDASTIPAGMTQTYDLDGTLDNSTVVTLAAGDNRTDVDFGYTGSVPSICLVKTGPATANVGDTITYHFKVTNTGNTYLFNVNVNDPMLGGVIWTKASMAPGEVCEFDKTYVVPSTTSTSGVMCYPTPPPPCPPTKLVNTATATGTPPAGGTVTSQSSWTVTINKAVASVGDRVWLDYNANGVQDAGEPGINGVKVNLLNSYGSVIATTTTAGNGIYEFTNLQPGKYTVAIVTSTLPANLKETYELDYTLDGRVTVTLASGDKRTNVDFGYTGNRPGICLVKTGPATAKIGDTITYHFKVTNTGNTYLYGGVTVNDPMLGGVIWHKTPVAPGEVNEFDMTYVVKSSSGTHSGIQCNPNPPSCGDQTKLVNTATAIGCPPIGCKVQCTSSCTTTITKLASFRTYTQGGWGSCPNGNNPGALLKANFSRVYAGGTVVIGGCKQLTFTSAYAIQKFLPQGGTPGTLRYSATNPCSTAAGVFAGQVLALRLNVDFSNAGVTTQGLGSVKLTSGSLAGRTIAEVLALAERVLGGDTSALPSGMTISRLNYIVTGINEQYDR